MLMRMHIIMVDRREFLRTAGALALSAQTAACTRGTPVAAPIATAPAARPGSWQALRAEFELDPTYLHFAGFLLACHPRVVRDEIALHRDRLQRNPVLALNEVTQREDEVRASAGEYLEADKAQIALTGSTTMGLSLLYNGFALSPGQEVLTSVHEHYATQEPLEFRAAREGIKLRKIRLFERPHQVTREEILHAVESNLSERTRVLALTWVHSGTGVKLPIGEIGAMVERKNEGRAERDRILFCVDGVHGLGVEDFTFAQLHCDYFVAGTHKWLFGPRGTGIICARSPQLSPLTPTIASFSSYDDFGHALTPGGYHAFEHQWAARRAFEFHLAIGKAQVSERIHALNGYLKQRLGALREIELVTPLGSELSAGFTIFRVAGRDPWDLEEALAAQRIMVSAAERDFGLVLRMAPGLLNDESEIDRSVDALVRLIRS